MYYPPCPGYDTAAAAPSSSGPIAPGVYVAPALTAAENCQPPYPGATPDEACILRNLATQASNQAALDAANRSVFVTNCNRDWEANKAQYEALGMPVPPNDCAYRTYGQTLPGTTGGTTAYLPSVPQEVVDWRSANPSGGVSVPWNDASAAILAPSSPASTAAPAGSATSSTQAAPRAAGGSAPSTAPKPSGFTLPGGGSITELLTSSVDLGGNEIPTWAVIAAAAVAAYFLFGGKK